jgi:hypothetical protein
MTEKGLRKKSTPMEGNPIPGRCGSPLRKKPGKYCEKWPLKDRTRCRLHGGLTPRGVAAPSFGNGRYSKCIPERLVATYEESRNNPQLLNLRDEASLLETRITDLIQSLRYQPTEASWKAAFSFYEQFKVCRAKQDGQGMGVALEKLGEVLTQGIDSAATWDRIQDTIDGKRKIVETIAKQDFLGAVAIERVMTLFVGMAEAVKDHVTDLKVRRMIYQRFEEMATRSGIAKPQEAAQTLDTKALPT